MQFFSHNSLRPVRWFVFSALLVFAALSAVAQSATSGAIGGTISDLAGALLPGTVVTVTSADNAATRKVKSNASGEYRVDELTPGTYTVTFVADGFETYVGNSVTVTVGSLANVSPKLKVGSTSDKVEVSGENPLMNTESNEFSTTLDQATIDNLPINGRRYSDFALLTPGVVSNSDGFGLLSFRGISYLLNNNTVDGADDNQAYFSEARGRTRAAYAISQSAIQEFQVNTSNYSAQYGRAAGGVINTVTKSGGNSLHGELFFYDRDNDLGGATNPYTLLNVSNGAGGYTSMPFKPTDWRKQWGFGVGGPIIRDKLFWFYSYDQSRRNFPLVARSTDPNDLLAPSDPTLPANETCSNTAFTSTTLNYYTEGDYNACALSATYGLNSFQAGSAYYQQGLGIINSFLGAVPRRADQVINLPKLDYQISDRQHLSLLYNRMRYSSPNGFYSQSTVTDGRDYQGNDFIKEDFGVARLTSVLSNAIINDGLVQYGRDFEYTVSPNPAPNNVPLASSQFHLAPAIQIGYNFGTVSTGANVDLNRYALPDERRLQLLDGVTWTHGKHVTKAGLEFNKVSDYINNLYEGFGVYSYDYGYTYIADYLNAVSGVGGSAYQAHQLYYGFNQAFGNPIGLITTREYAGYLTDDWRVLPNLTLTVGLRYEYEYVPNNPYFNPALTVNGVQVSGEKPDDRNNVGPRVGFAWQPYGNGRTVVRGGYGLYYGRIINSNILQTYLESGASNAQSSTPSLYSGSTTCGVFPVFPLILTAAPNCTSTKNVAYLDSHTQNPQVSEADLAIEQNLGHNTTMQITYMASFGHELPDAIDVNFNAAATYNATFNIGSSTIPAGTTSYPISATSEASFKAGGYPMPPASGYITLPHGGRKSPLQTGQQFATKVFLVPLGGSSTRPNQNFAQILDVRSDVNSNYNALAIQINHRFEHGLAFMGNYTWSHALDENPYIGTGVATYNIYDPTNRRLEYGNSGTNVPNRGVADLIYEPQTNFHGYKQYLLGGWRVAPLVQVQNGLPYTPYLIGSSSAIPVPLGVDGCTVSLYTPGLTTCAATPAYKGLNGSGSTANRLPTIERNSYQQPMTAVIDLRLGKNFYIDVPHLSHARFEVFAEMFNVANHQNITAVQNDAYNVSATTLTPYTGANTFGTYTNSNSNYSYSPRQVQVAARLHF